MNESKISCKCKYKCNFDGAECNSNQTWNKDKCQFECENPKEHHVCKIYIYLKSCYVWM